MYMTVRTSFNLVLLNENARLREALRDLLDEFDQLSEDYERLNEIVKEALRALERERNNNNE